MTAVASLFTRKSNEPESTPSDPNVQWGLERWSEGERMNISRWRMGLRVPDRTRPIKINIKLGYADGGPNGLPDAAALDRFETIENILIPELAAHNALLVMILTGYNAREFIAYGSSHEFLEQFGPTVLERWGGTTFGTEVNAERDAKWKTFRRYSGRSRR